MSARHRLLLPVFAVLFGLSACGSTPAAAPPASVPPTSAAPTSSAPPTSVVPAATTSATAATEPTAAAPGCPSAKTLERLVDLPKGWYFIPSKVQCWKGWATAEPHRTTPADGVYLFHYQAGKGWRYHSQGSGYHCKEIGINEAAPFCQYP